MSSAVTGYLSTYGVDEPAGCYDDLDQCDVLITWGNNPAEMHPVLFSRVMDRRSKGEKVLLIDDVMTTGTTARVCATVLRSGGAGEVALAVLARARRNSMLGLETTLRSEGEETS
jgi:nitrate reductase NapA